ncbi:hypothetical protein FHS95_003267 [Sphingomonas naasensis]|uniref:Uncharacterized protein n=1 Tax=Sphingomonas naasensis TaxID=1344951 RepID=A0A4S1WIH9_9SPHN|nr:hypothetical protein [Sphingomonas naasensis]NIJ21564.1 hypothetical protein [Sphingomonas naasensis]TGX41490.1 hypothetical protein E5A74_12770 [Sphingomonas naasensis]
MAALIAAATIYRLVKSSFLAVVGGVLSTPGLLFTWAIYDFVYNFAPDDPPPFGMLFGLLILIGAALPFTLVVSCLTVRYLRTRQGPNGG